MMNFKIISRILLIIFITSCSSTITSFVVGSADIYKDVKVLKKDRKTVIFLPMVHVGRDSYFKDCKDLIDSLRQENFKIYYENIAHKGSLDSVEKREYDLKVRSILGYNPRLSKGNNSLPKFYSRKNYVLQDYNMMGITVDDINLDLDKKAIIDSIESKYGELDLNDCDLSTALDAEYHCKNDNENYLFAFTNEYRDPFIASEVLKLDHEKVVLIYGKQHWYFIYPKLYKNGYKLIKGKV